LILNIINSMGSGKTLYSTIFACQYHLENPNNLIYANYLIDLPRKIFRYIPYCILPISKLHDCLIIIDDCFLLRNIKNYTLVFVNMSRKADITVLLTAQYYTQIPKEIRDVSNYEVRVKYNRKKDILKCRFIDLDYRFHIIKIKNCRFYFDFYNTQEIVKPLLDSKILSEIKNICKNKDDIEQNITFLVRNKREQKQLIKELSY